MQDILQQLYGDVVTEESLAKFKEELGKKFVPKADFNQRGEELKMLREKLAEQETAAAGLREAEEEKNFLLEELSGLKEKYEHEIAAAKERENEIRLSHAVDNVLTQAKAKNLIAVRALLNMDGVAFVDGKLSGLDEQLEKIMQENSYLFEAGEANPQFIRPSAFGSELSQEDFQKLGYMERLKLKKEQPELYQTLTKNSGGKNLWQHI
ncbi:MAG: phage scaffolding protein [Clostridia bacterium]|nr:phage scaffolding protein [Clostridia bacterium]